MSQTTRRVFLQGAGGAVAASAMSQARPAKSQSVSPNEKLTLGVIGLRNQGRNDMNTFLGTKMAEVAWMADPDYNLARAYARGVEKAQQKAPKVVRDFREVLDDKSVDAVVIATPDHWHAIATVMACQAGKDVYVEKPASHNVKEGRAMVEAARKYKRVVQVGSHQRSAEHYQKACAFVRSGKLGKISMAKAGVVHRRDKIGVKPDCDPPPAVDYDLWLGPAPKRPFNPNRFHYNWHWWWDYGTGEMGNWAAHHLDIVMWYLDLGYPTAVSAAGGTFFFDDREVPDTQIVLYEYPDRTVVWEQRLWDRAGGEGVEGSNFFGDQAAVMINRGGWKVVPEGKKKSPEFHKGTTPLSSHVRNFIDCVKGRKTPNADIACGHKTAVLCHLGNIALRLKRRLVFDGKTETIVGDAEASTYLTREYRKPYVLPEV